MKSGLCKVIQNPGFLRMSMSVTILYFVLTIIQFWGSDFLITVMKLEKEMVFGLFGFVSISGPVFGVIFGGYVSSKLGGYNNPKTLYCTAIISIFAIIVSIPIPYLGYKEVWL